MVDEAAHQKDKRHTGLFSRLMQGKYCGLLGTPEKTGQEVFSRGQREGCVSRRPELHPCVGRPVTMCVVLSPTVVWRATESVTNRADLASPTH